MTFVAAAVVGGASLAGSFMQADAAKKAAKSQERAAKYASDLQYQQWRDYVDMQQPWIDAGKKALNKLVPLSEYSPFSMSKFVEDPGYSFRLSEGQKAIENSAAAQNSLLSGKTLKAIQRFGQNMASDEYNNAFNRYLTEYQTKLAPLQSLAGVGQTSTQQVGNSGMMTAQNRGDLLTSGAAARASGYIGQANALTNALNTGMNFYQNQQFLNKVGQ